MVYLKLKGHKKSLEGRTLAMSALDHGFILDILLKRVSFDCFVIN
jgi:hypothetical protein